MGTSLGSSAPQMRAASWKTMRRWAPTVVPVLPPTGVAGVGSLKPTPAASVTTIWTSAAASWRAASARAKERPARRGRRVTGSPSAVRLAGRRGGGGGRGNGGLRGGVPVDATLDDGPAVAARGDRVGHVRVAELDHRSPVRQGHDPVLDGDERPAAEELLALGGRGRAQLARLGIL